MKKRILYISRYPNFFGGNRCLYHLVAHLDRARFEPVLMIPAGSYYKEKFAALGVEIHEYQTSIPLKLNNAGKIIEVNRELMRFVKRERIDLVHINEESCLAESLLAFFLWARMRRLPIIFHNRSAGMVFGALKRFTLLLGTIVCVSERVRGEFAKPRRSDILIKPNAGNLITIYDGIETEQFAAETGVEGLRREFSLNGESIVGYVSAIDPRKRQDVFIEAAAEVVKKFPKTKFMIVGDIYDGTPVQLEYKRKVLKMTEDFGLQKNVIFTGYRDDVTRIFKLLDIFVLTSENEGLGDVVIEAMASGKAVVSTCDGGPAEIVEEGKTGYLIRDFRNPKSYAEKISELLADQGKRKAMGEAGVRRAEKIFGIQAHTDSIQNLYGRLLAK